MHLHETYLLFPIGLLAFLLTIGDTAPAQAADGTAHQTFTNSIGMEFVLIPADAYPEISVKAFYLGKYEVTQEQWEAVMGNNPAEFKGRSNPVEHVSWNDAQEFIKRLNQKEGIKLYRLPTNIEWEYAARGGAGLERMYFFMENLEPWMENFELRAEVAQNMDAYVWFNKNSRQATHPVGQKKPNLYGLYDVYGNVWEWVHDEEVVPDAKTFRGGSWNNTAGSCGSTDRLSRSPDFRDNDVGFRLALSLE